MSGDIARVQTEVFPEWKGFMRMPYPAINSYEEGARDDCPPPRFIQPTGRLDADGVAEWKQVIDPYTWEEI